MKRTYPPFKALLALGLPAMLILPGCEGGPADPVHPEVVPAFGVKAKLPSAIGTTQFDVGGELRTLVVDAREEKDGTVGGFWMIHNRVFDFVSKYDVKCLIVKDNVAYIAGVYADNPKNYAACKLVDNGSGANGPPDQDTQTFKVGEEFFKALCTDPGLTNIDKWDLYDTEGGDIRVQGG